MNWCDPRSQPPARAPLGYLRCVENGCPLFGMRIDFLLPEHGLTIELKHSRKSMTKKNLGELTVDVGHYKNHSGVWHIVCLVFDEAGHIDNPRGLERDLSRVHDGLAVTARIFDRG